MAAQISFPHRAQQRVADRMHERIGIGMSLQPPGDAEFRVRPGSTYVRPPGMNIPPHPTRTPVIPALLAAVRDWRIARRSRDLPAFVTLIFSNFPRPPRPAFQQLDGCASSVAWMLPSSAFRCASSSAARRKALRVCANHRGPRSMVRSITPLAPTYFTVSRIGSAMMAAPCSRRCVNHGVSCPRSKRPHRIVHENIRLTHLGQRMTNRILPLRSARRPW